ncbi:MAG: hypothetical protein IJY47_07215 [Clostridia bacterium]|nr:hypothetical protein [Clostridia bacterium]
MNEKYNPIKSVDGVAVKCPSSYKWRLEDLSAGYAGRTEGYQMDKARLGQVIGLDLKWKNVTTEDASAILKAFNPEYIRVCYLDPKEGLFRTSEFYVGDRAAPLYNCQTGLWSEISFSIIERGIELVKTDESYDEVYEEIIKSQEKNNE